MKATLILFGAIAVCGIASAQCPEFRLVDLQALQRSDADQKENNILQLGYDLRSEFTSKGSTVKSYTKCWNSNFRQQPVFEQLIWWNQTVNSVTFFTLNEEHFKALRASIIERHSNGNMTENPDFYIGRMFQYRFGAQRVDGIEYFFVSITQR